MTTFPIAFEFQNFVLDCCGALSAVCFSAGAVKALGSWQPFCHHEVSHLGSMADMQRKVGRENNNKKMLGP